jgi:hypothetical protein
MCRVVETVSFAAGGVFRASQPIYAAVVRYRVENWQWPSGFSTSNQLLGESQSKTFSAAESFPLGSCINLS